MRTPAAAVAAATTATTTAAAMMWIRIHNDFNILDKWKEK